jgi:hypothetical protein
MRDSVVVLIAVLVVVVTGLLVVVVVFTEVMIELSMLSPISGSSSSETSK